MATISSTRQPDKTVQNAQGCGVRNSTARPASGGNNNSSKKNKKWPPSQTSGSMASTMKWMDVNGNNSSRRQNDRSHHYSKIMSFDLVVIRICVSHFCKQKSESNGRNVTGESWAEF
jgi:hypothetical protein